MAGLFLLSQLEATALQKKTGSGVFYGMNLIVLDPLKLLTNPLL